MSMLHDHCVGFFKSKDNAVALEHDLKALGIHSWSDQIPYAGIRDSRTEFLSRERRYSWLGEHWLWCLSRALVRNGHNGKG